MNESIMSKAFKWKIKKLNVDDDDHNSIYSCGKQFNKSTRTEIMNE